MLAHHATFSKLSVFNSFFFSTLFIFSISSAEAERISEAEWSAPQRGVAVFKTEQGNEVISRGASVFTLPSPAKQSSKDKNIAGEMDKIKSAAKESRMESLYRKFLSEGRYSKVKSIGVQVDRAGREEFEQPAAETTGLAQRQSIAKTQAKATKGVAAKKTNLGDIPGFSSFKKKAQQRKARRASAVKLNTMTQLDGMRDINVRSLYPE